MAQQPKPRKIPQRKCIACQKRGDKKKLERIVKNKEGEIFVDPSGKANGRGAYVHLSEDCIERAHKHHLIERSFKTSIPDSVFEQLREELSKSEQ